MAIVGEQQCPMCHGRGTTEQGAPCNGCDGTGRIPIYDSPDEEKRR